MPAPGLEVETTQRLDRADSAAIKPPPCWAWNTMTNLNERVPGMLLRVLLAALLAFAPGVATAQDGQFDLRTRGSPSPEPTVVGPVDPESPTIRARPQPAPVIVLPTAQPRPTASAEQPTASPTQPAASPRTRSPQPRNSAAPQRPGADSSAQPSGEAALPLPATSAAAPPASATASAKLPGAVQPRNLERFRARAGSGCGWGWRR